MLSTIVILINQIVMGCHRPAIYIPSRFEREWGEHVVTGDEDGCSFIRSNVQRVKIWLAALRVRNTCENACSEGSLSTQLMYAKRSANRGDILSLHRNSIVWKALDSVELLILSLRYLPEMKVL